jgi:GxxExxY protein
MPIEQTVRAKLISDDEFHFHDYEVMGLAYSIHNDLGRLWNEKIYQNELAYRCQKAGFEKVDTEVAIHVSYQDFRKTLYTDLLLNNLLLYELKAVQALTGEHHKQTLNYLLR